MVSERLQRRIDALLEEADTAMARLDWATVAERARAVLVADPGNEDGSEYLSMAERGFTTGESQQESRPPLGAGSAPTLGAPSGPPAPSTMVERQVPTEGHGSGVLPASFAAGRYAVRGFLGKGGSKLVYLAHDTRLDRDVALAVVEGLEGDALERVRREAQAVARLGDHPNIVSVFDTGDEGDALYTVYQYMAGGALADRVAATPDHRLPLEDAVRYASQVCAALSFAHGKGVIHRDLKPQNVFLDDDGTAKLGDFGLAAALDRTRLTQHGTFLGTAVYMPPEQAMGQPPDPRSDLYALGCVLYEMLTGRPPFVGDDTVAIVTQHLNTPPIAPAWHRPDVPAGLEALVLSLLEKDPAKRPKSAAEVQASLAAVALTPGPSPDFAGEGSNALAQHSALNTSSADPLYRTVFVGREAELRQLQAAFDTALSGAGGLVMVVGEPGIGKTALTEQLATYVAMRGGRTLHGNCYEEGSLSLPYLPFVEAMRSYVLERDPDALRTELGSGAPYVAKIVSEAREKVHVDLPPAGDPEDERWRLLSAVTTFLKNGSGVQPLVIVLEDLHWSDRGTLDLLNHLARNLQGGRLLIVGTYRDVEVDRSHPLSAALADLRRITDFTRVTLRGLGVEDVEKMLAAIAGRELPRQVAGQVHRQTEGNPLFVQEVARWLVEEGHLPREGHRGGDELLAMQIPEGLRDVIGRRISRLSNETNRVLAVAAVIGRDFSFDVLSAVARLPEEEVLVAVEEATKVGVLQEQAGAGAAQYRFAHAFMRQTLYEEMIAPRRLRLHQEVARALETRYARRLDEHAAELAEHFSYSTDPADLEKAVAYAQRAAEQAMAVFDYGEAGRLLEKALGVQEVLDPDDMARLCELKLALGWARQREGDQASARELAMAVATAAKAAGLVNCMVGAAELVGSQTFFPIETDQPFGQLFDDLLDILPPGDSGERAYAMGRLGLYLAASGADYQRADELTEAALDMARQVGDPARLARALMARSSAVFQLPLAGTVDEVLSVRLALADELERAAPAGLQEAEAIAVRVRLGVALARGDMAAAERHVSEFEALGRRYRSSFLEAMSHGTRSALLLGMGELGRALELVEQFHQGIGTSPTGENMGSLPTSSSRVFSAVGRRKEAEESLGALRQERLMGGLYTAWVLARHGDLARARALYSGHRDRYLASQGKVHLFQVQVSELCAFLNDQSGAAVLYEALAPLAGFNVGSFNTIMPSSSGPADRCLGLLATTMGQFEVAEKHFFAAMEQCERQGTPTFLVESQSNYADLLLRRDGPGDRAKAWTLLSKAIEGARAIGYVWLVEQALALQLQSQGVAGSDPHSSIVAVSRLAQAEQPDLSRVAAPDGSITLMFTDIEGSTALNERLGDKRWVEILRHHNAVVEREVEAHGGTVVKNRGDGYMAVFRRPERALTCALAIQKALLEPRPSVGAGLAPAPGAPDGPGAPPAMVDPQAATEGRGPIRVRIGLHTGNPVREGKDFFGTDVNLATRVADRALGGQVLVSSRLYELLGSERAGRFGEAVEVEPKDLAGTHRVHVVR